MAMNKEFRDWLEKEEKELNQLTGGFGRGAISAHRAVMGRYDELHKPVVIPKYVADWIENIKPDNSLRIAFEYIAQRKADNHDDPLAFWIEEGNSETFARAWLDGYEVEQETKYVVKAPHTASNYYTKSSRRRIGIAIMLTTSDIAREDGLFHFTEKEINELLPDVPEKYWEEIK